MSAPVKPYNNNPRLLPLPLGSANKASSESTNVPAPNLPNIVPKESARSHSERPQLPEPTESPEAQTSPPTPSNTHRPMLLPETIRPKVERRLTVSPANKRTIFKSPPKFESKEQKISLPPSSSTLLLKPETLSLFDEKDMAKYNQEFDKFAAELEDEFVDEFPGALNFEAKAAQPSTKGKPESTRSKSTKLATSLDGLEIRAHETVPNRSEFNSPEKNLLDNNCLGHNCNARVMRGNYPPQPTVGAGRSSPRKRAFKVIRTTQTLGLKTVEPRTINIKKNAPHLSLTAWHIAQYSTPLESGRNGRRERHGRRG